MKNLQMNEDKLLWWIVTIVSVFVFTIVVAVVFIGKEYMRNNDLERLKICQEIANQNGLDPNDDKISFISDCMK